MRGSPLVQTIFAVLVFALAGLPIWRLTRPASAAAAGPVAAVSTDASSAARPLEIEAIFAPAPTDFEIKNLDQTVLSGQGPQARFSSRWTANLPAEGADLVVRAHWLPAASGEAPIAAARIAATMPDGTRTEKSFWARPNGALQEVFTIPGAAGAGR